jgi:nucleotide-binding universal stress UspA family protein
MIGVIEEVVKDHAIDLIVMGTRGVSGMEEFFI